MKEKIKLREDRLKKKFKKRRRRQLGRSFSAAEDLTEVHTHTFVHQRQNSENILQIVRLLPSWYTHTDEIEHIIYMDSDELLSTANKIFQKNNT
jgi:hypothetical protein